MATQGRRREPEGGGQLTGTPWPFPEQLDYTTAAGVGQSRQNVVNLSACA
jgi:hypothetical protein